MTFSSLMTYDFLHNEHVVLKKTAVVIGKEQGCTAALVCMYLKRANIENQSNTYKRGKPLNCPTKFQKGLVPWNKGLSTPSSNKGKTFPRQELHWNWKGGPKDPRRQNDPKYRDWRKAVYERDNYTCQFCGVRGTQLNADHIKPWSLFPDLRYDLENGRTLCVPCHRTTDTYGSRIKKQNDGGTLKSVLLT